MAGETTLRIQLGNEWYITLETISKYPALMHEEELAAIGFPDMNRVSEERPFEKNELKYLTLFKMHVFKDNLKCR